MPVLKILLLLLAFPFFVSGKSYYQSCGEPWNKNGTGCFGIPPNCVEIQNCTTLLKFHASSSDPNLYFNLIGFNITNEGAMAVGFSDNMEMNSGIFIRCYGKKSGKGLKLNITEFYRTNSSKLGFKRVKFNAREKDQVLGHYDLKLGKKFRCTFSLPPKFDMPNYIHARFSLETDPVFIYLLSRTKEANRSLGNSSFVEGVSSRKIHLYETAILKTASEAGSPENLVQREKLKSFGVKLGGGVKAFVTLIFSQIAVVSCGLLLRSVT